MLTPLHRVRASMLTNNQRTTTSACQRVRSPSSTLPSAITILTTPPATVQKIVSEILPPSSGCIFAKEARDLLIECCVEFITLISSEANEISEKEAKKTIACDHITKALEQLGFSDYVPAVLEAAAEHKETQKVCCCSVSFLFISLNVEGNGLLTVHAGTREEGRQVCAERAVDRGAREDAGRAVRPGRRAAQLIASIIPFTFSFYFLGP